MSDHARTPAKTKRAKVVSAAPDTAFPVPSPKKKVVARMTAVPPSASAAAVSAPAATNAASFPSTAPTAAGNEFANSTIDSRELNKCKFVSEVVGAPHAQQLSTITVQVNPNAFPPQAFDIDDDTTGGARTAEMVKMAQKQEIQSDRCWRCPPYTPVFTTTAMKSRPADGTPLVMAHVPDGMNPVDASSSTWFRFVGVTLEDGAEDTTALKRHSRTGKCKFTVATKGCVTIACSPQNAREAQFVYGDPFCISLYEPNILKNQRISGPSGKRARQDVPTIRSTAFSGRLESDGHRTFVYSKKGIRIGTYVKLLEGVNGGALVELL